VDWHFFQRREEDCRCLFEQAGYDMDRLQIARDSTGVIMNFIGWVEAGVSVRVDHPAERPGHAPIALKPACVQPGETSQVP
jgi:hypothetical protein